MRLRTIKRVNSDEIDVEANFGKLDYIVVKELALLLCTRVMPTFRIGQAFSSMRKYSGHVPPIILLPSNIYISNSFLYIFNLTLI